MADFTETITGMRSVFTPPASCSNSWTYEGSYYNSISRGILMQNLLQAQFDTRCFPSGFGGYGRAQSSVELYSPGACPAGYATPGVFNNAGTTTGICCPSSFSYYSTYSSINFFGSDSVLYQGCISTLSGTTTVSARSGNTGLSQTVVSGPITMWGQPIIIEYQQKDLSLFATATSTSRSGTSGPSSTSSITSATSSGSSSANNNSSPDTGSSGLSTGAQAGIGVGVAVVVLAIIGVAALLFIRKRKQRNGQPPNGSGPYSYSAVAAPNGGGVSEYYGKQPPNAQNGVLHEAYGDQVPNGGRQEMAAAPVIPGPRTSGHPNGSQLGAAEMESNTTGSVHGHKTNAPIELE